MSKHSEGPWQVEVHEKTTSIEGKYQTIACDVSNCDAHLIAAAPEMLDFLRVFLTPGLGRTFQQDFDEARRLVLKAEGRSHE